MSADEDITGISEPSGQALLAAVDETFCEVLHGRYGGGVTVVLSRGGTPIDEKTIRQSSTDQGVIELSLSLRGPSDAAHRERSNTVVVGVVTMKQPPEHGTDDVHVVTEVFDALDLNEAADAGCLATGVLLVGAPMGQAGQMPGGGLSVMRSGAAMGASDVSAQQQQRGWMSLQPRGRVNRSGGLGSNGFRRSTIAGTVHPMSRPLLTQLADRLVRVPDLGPALSRVVLGLRAGVAAAS